MLKGIEVALYNHTSSRAIARTQYTSFSPTNTRYRYFYQIIVLIEGQEVYSDLYLKKIGKIYLVMVQTFDLYANLYET
jgi:hypothetical protein